MNPRSWSAGLAAAAVLAMGGCTLDNVMSDYAPGNQPNSGVVVMALSRTGAIEFDMNALLARTGGGSYTVVVDNNKVQKDFGKVVIPPPGSQASDWGYVPANDPLGRLIVASLPAGNYEFKGITGVAPRFSGTYPSRFSIKSEAPGLSFTVKPGEVTYLGSVVFGFPDWLSQSHYLQPLKVTTMDTRERDAKLVKERFPNLSSSLPERALTGAGEPKQVRFYLYVEGDGASAKD